MNRTLKILYPLITFFLLFFALLPSMRVKAIRPLDALVIEDLSGRDKAINSQIDSGSKLPASSPTPDELKQFLKEHATEIQAGGGTVEEQAARAKELWEQEQKKKIDQAMADYYAGLPEQFQEHAKALEDYQNLQDGKKQTPTGTPSGQVPQGKTVIGLWDEEKLTEEQLKELGYEIWLDENTGQKQLVKDSGTGTKGYTETWNASSNPWDLLSGRSGLSHGILALGGSNFYSSVLSVLRRTLIICCVIGVLMSLISIPFISNSQQLREKKEELTNRALIFALSFAIFPILSFIKMIMDFQFGFR